MKKTRVGIVGCGVIAPTHAAALLALPHAELVACYDVLPEKAEKLGKEFGARTASSLDELLADPEVDAISVCTPSGLHAEIAVAALRAGRAVIIEKPMDVTVEACQRIIEAQKETGKLVTVISQHRWDAASQFVWKAVQEGKLGRIVFAEASVNWHRTQAYYDSGDWRGTWAMDGGGALMNQGVHTVDLLLWLAGPVKSLSARTRTATHERIEVEDIAAATLEFENGAIGTLTATTAAFPGFPARLALYGTEGTAIIEGDRLKLFQTRAGESLSGDEAALHALSVAQGGSASVEKEAQSRTASADPGAVWGDSHRAQLSDFVHALQTGAKPLLAPEQALESVRLVTAVYHSAQTGQTARF